MSTCILLLRGINVGGKNLLPMQALVTHLEDIGARNVKTYIQSGNAVFSVTETDPADLSLQLATRIKQHHGFDPSIIILTLAALRSAISNNPFPDAEPDPTSLHLGFLAISPKNPDLEKLDRLKAANERFQLGAGVFYLHAPDGMGRSKLAANCERALGVPMTDRNWRTVCKIRELAAGYPEEQEGDV